MFVPDAVLSLAVRPKNRADDNNFSKALNRFQKEDPTFRVHFDAVRVALRCLRGSMFVCVCVLVCISEQYASGCARDRESECVCQEECVIAYCKFVSIFV